VAIGGVKLDRGCRRDVYDCLHATQASAGQTFRKGRDKMTVGKVLDYCRLQERPPGNHLKAGIASMSKPVNDTEQFVLGLCLRSVLTPWCYNNPKGKHGDELCDVLVVCEPHIIIVSVKAVERKGGEPTLVDHERWQRKAVDASVRQIYGAEKWLTSATRVVRSDGSPGLLLPAKDSRKVHRIAVAFGCPEGCMVSSGEFGKGYVHVLTETGVHEILGELDTITDLADYLAAKEELVARGCAVIQTGTQGDLLAWYLHNGRSFPGDANLLHVDDTVWEGPRTSPEFQRRKEADRESYAWDHMIEYLSRRDLRSSTEVGPDLTDIEIALRVMARETRLSRRILGRGLGNFHSQRRERPLRSRVMMGTSGVIYVLVRFFKEESLEQRQAALVNRCFSARHEVGSGTIASASASRNTSRKFGRSLTWCISTSGTGLPLTMRRPPC
jgi:hypothetical protein